MSIAPYLREVGRGREGARALTREQAAALMGTLLDGPVSDLEVGAWCMAMRMKGETPQELAGFLDAIGMRLARIEPTGKPTVILPSYNGARRLPVLTPLLALLLQQQGIHVILHGQGTESSRVTSAQVLKQPDLAPWHDAISLRSTEQLLPGLSRLLVVREVIGVRNTAHTLVKLLNPSRAPALLMSCYTHPEYRESMGQTLVLSGQPALLFRGTEGEPVFDPRRQPRVEWIDGRERRVLEDDHEGPLRQLPELCDAHPAQTARWIREVLEGKRPIPAPIAQQVQLARQALDALKPGAPAAGGPTCRSI